MSLVLPRRIGLLVGNGLTLSLLFQNCNGGEHWSTQNPLRWNITNAKQPARFLIDEHPELGSAYRELRRDDPAADDFALIDRMLSGMSGKDFGSPIAWQLRNYLAMAFSHLQLGVLDTSIRDGYQYLPWSRWFRAYGAEMVAAVSFNYDLVLERLLAAAGVPAFRPSVEQHPLALPIVKPHSSIDFGPAIMGATIINSDVPQRLLSREQMLASRREFTMVLPGEPSQNGDLQWVRPGVEFFRNVSSTFTDLVLIGLSYWDVDRDEIDMLLERVPSETRIVMANPRPSSEWLATLHARHPRIQVWTDGPQDLV